jgi:VWFA-related protein
MLRVPIRACLSGMLLASALAWLPAQEQPGRSQSSSGILFKQSVRRVILDVVVTDSMGRPVRDLTEKDFAVTEDGKPQRVLSFDVHDFDPTLDFTPPKLPPLPANTFVNVPTTPERGPLYVILYDLVNMEQDNQAYARQQLLKFIKSKPEGARFAIFVLSDGLHLVQGFSSDPGRLLEDGSKGRRPACRSFSMAATMAAAISST